MSIPTKSDEQPIEFSTKIRYVIIFAQLKYETHKDILEALKFIISSWVSLTFR